MLRAKGKRRRKPNIKKSRSNFERFRIADATVIKLWQNQSDEISGTKFNFLRFSRKVAAASSLQFVFYFTINILRKKKKRFCLYKLNNGDKSFRRENRKRILKQIIGVTFE